MTTAHAAQAPKSAWLRPTQLGFTLIEAMITVGIMSALVAIAVPALRPLTSKTHLREEAESVAGFLDLARRTAFNEGRCVRVNLSSGMLIMARRNHADCVTDVTTGAWTTVRSQAPLYKEHSFTVTSSGAPASTLIFRPHGWLRGDADHNKAEDTGRVAIASTREPNKLGILVTSMSRICIKGLGSGALPALSSAADSLCP
ncbi:MAG: GspH/FimT family pseudopilin [Pseudomonadota bacterium]